MHIKALLFSAAAYTAITFALALAVVWHIVLFEDRYQTFGYFDGEPNFLQGVSSIAIQAAVLSFLYPRVVLKGDGVARGLKYASLVGVFFWTSHVLAFLAKRDLAQAADFAVMESFYLLLQFGCYGACVGAIYRKFGGAKKETL